jgi:hypothetical protein
VQSQQRTQSEILKETRIDESGPGTILKDYQMLLDFIGTGVKTGGKNYRLPLAALKQLDERMTHPLRPKLERPQQTSFPHLNGLYLLFRSSGMGTTSGQGTSGLLYVQPDRLREWNDLNPSERYMTLFQSLLQGEWGLVDSNAPGGPNIWSEIRFSMSLYTRPIKDKTGITAAELIGTWPSQGSVALLELFGILEITRKAPKTGDNWRIGSVKFTEFGTAFLAPLQDSTHMDLIMGIVHPQLIGKRTEGVWLGDLYREFFPECQNTLGENEEVFVDGVWQFKVTLWDTWRRIQIPADISVEDLVDCILTAFRFSDREHLYEFRVRERSGRYMTIGHPQMNEVDYLTDEFAIGSLPLEPGMSMNFLFDFGASWNFDVKLEKILPVNPKMEKPKVVEKEGKAPKQYED